MEKLYSVLDGKAKRVIEAIGKSGQFYETALKTLKHDFGNPLVVSQSKLKSLFDQPQIKRANRIYTTMGYNTPILSNENLPKSYFCIYTGFFEVKF